MFGIGSVFQAKKAGKMRKIAGKVFTWYILLNKRLLKRYSFILMLVLLPLLLFGLKSVSKEESGILHIALVLEENSYINNEIKKELTDKESIILIKEERNKDEALSMLKSGKFDAVWILPKNIEEKINKYLSKGDYLIEVYEKENSTILNLAREKLYKAVNPFISYQVYEKYMHKLLSYNELNDGEKKAIDTDLKKYYNKQDIDKNLLKFAYIDGDEYVEKQDKKTYLLSPVRGLVAMWLVLCAMAVNIYFLQDEKSGLFVWIDRKSRWLFSLAYQFAIMFNLALFSALILWLMKMGEGGLRQLLAMGLLLVSAIAFTSLLRLVFRNMNILISLIPIMLLYLLISAPIFIDIGYKGIQGLSPIYYYLNLVYDISYLLPYTLYTGLCLLIGFAIFKFKR